MLSKLWIELRIYWKRWTKWEFWPFYVFYVPVYFYWLYLGIRARSLAFFTAANPAIETGGFIDYSKAAVLRKIPDKWLPLTLYLKQDSLTSLVIQQWMLQHQLSFPIIIKPDKGERGFGVEKISSSEEVEQYIHQYLLLDEQFIVQEYIDQPLEFGVMYSRLPDEERGVITSVVEKKLLLLQGDGQHSLEELILADSRASYHYLYFKKLLGLKLECVIDKGVSIPLVAVGNHCRGATFLNANHLINRQLTQVFDTISREISGYYFGRYDLKVNSLDDLYAGKIKIIELNGANSEPAHIYDPNMKLWPAYRDLFAHWHRLYKVSIANHCQGVAYLPFSELYHKIRYHWQAQKKIANSESISV